MINNISVKIKDIKQSFLLGCLLGSVVFCLTYGIKILDFSYDAWLLNGGDLTQHYLGWCLYRDSSWYFPLGLTPEYAWPYKISVMYADVIPICAVFFKLLSPLLPKTFQYFGFWGLLCYALQGGLAAVLLRRFIPSVWQSGVFSLFFILGTQVMYRMFGHTALGAQWILLLALIFLFCRDWFPWERFWRFTWGGMGAFCVWVHGYFVPMVFLILLTAIYMHCWRSGDRKEALILICCYTCSVFASMWLLGAFSISFAAGSSALGEYGANLDTFFNPILPSMSRFMPTYPIFLGQMDGYAYLGLGGLVLLLLAFLRIILKKLEGEAICEGYAPVIVLWLVCVLMAVLPKACFHDIVLFHLNYPEQISRLLSIFRGSGRFIWIPTYLVLLFALVKVAKINKRIYGLKAGTVIVLLMLLVQMADFSLIIKNFHRNVYDGLDKYYNAVMEGREYHATGEGRVMLKNFEVVDEIMKKHKYVAYTDYHAVCNFDRSMMISYYAYKNNVKLKAFYLSRMPEKQLKQEQEQLLKELLAGNPREDTLYVIADKKESAQYKGLTYYDINGILLGSKNNIGD